MAEYFIIETTLESNGLDVETWEFGPFDSLNKAMEDAKGLLLNTAAQAAALGDAISPNTLDQTLGDLISERWAVLSTATQFIGLQVEER